MGVPSFGGCDEGGRNRGDRNIYLQAEEKGGALHSNSPHSATMPRYIEESGILDTGNVMRVIRNQEDLVFLEFRWGGRIVET